MKNDFITPIEHYLSSFFTLKNPCVCAALRWLFQKEILSFSMSSEADLSISRTSETWLLFDNSKYSKMLDHFHSVLLASLFFLTVFSTHKWLNVWANSSAANYITWLLLRLDLIMSLGLHSYACNWSTTQPTRVTLCLLNCVAWCLIWFILWVIMSESLVYGIKTGYCALWLSDLCSQ